MTKNTINGSQEGCLNIRQQKRNGRPPMYTKWIVEKGLAQVRNWAEEGLVNKQIANKMGINVATLYEWQDRFPEFANAIKKGKKIIDEQVENSLLKKALGYQYEEETWRKSHDGQMVLIKRVVKSQAPDVTAQIFWLKNRMPEKWRDKQEVRNEHTGSVKVEISTVIDRWSQ